MEKLSSVKITYVVFRANDGEYAVVRGIHEGNELCLTGGLQLLNEGVTIDVVGEWKKHPKYGVQFAVHSYIECRPTDLDGIENYLKSGLISGIGAVSARSIVEYFKEKTFEVLDTNPDRLLEVPGIGQERAAQIKAAWAEQQGVRDTLLFLSAFGVSTTLCLRIYKRYREETIQKVQENPYCLADDIDGIDFQMADGIALALGVDRQSYQRCRSGVLYYLSKLGVQGHCFATMSNVLQGVCKLLNVPMKLIERAMQHMHNNEDIIIEDGVRVYPKLYYDYEVDVAQAIHRIMNSPRDYEIVPLESYAANVDYTEKQLAAIRAGTVEHKLIVITGEPGSGKTTTVKGIVDTYKNNHKRVLLASPTGRAAKVLTMATGQEAMTIHRLLEYSPVYGFGYNEENPLYGDVLIVDELSMVDIALMRHLLMAVPDNMTVIFVGDADQIPSVGPGNVLADLIASGVVPVYKLDQIFRQGEGSHIKLAAHNINLGVVPDLSNPAGSDFSFLLNLDEAKVAEMVVKLRTELLPKKCGVDAVYDIHVIAPMYKGEAGVTKLNQMLQKALNPQIYTVKSGAVEFGVGDKVIQTRNDYDKDVYNGSIGIVVEVDTENRSLKVDFGGVSPVEYSSFDLGDLDLGYATTIHKAQGSEYPIVLIPVVQAHGHMWYRKLLYTAVTRAKKRVVLIGSENVLRDAISKTATVERNTRLWERLRTVQTCEA